MEAGVTTAHHLASSRDTLPSRHVTKSRDRSAAIQSGTWHDGHAPFSSRVGMRRHIIIRTYHSQTSGARRPRRRTQTQTSLGASEHVTRHWQQHCSLIARSCLPVGGFTAGCCGAPRGERSTSEGLEGEPRGRDADVLRLSGDM